MVLLANEDVEAIVEGLAERFGENNGKLDIFCVHLDNVLDARLKTIEAQNARIVEFIARVEALEAQLPGLIEQMKDHPILGNLVKGFGA